MWHSPLVEWKHALAKQCGLDLVFPCIIMKMFVSAIVSLLLLGTAAPPCLSIMESKASPFSDQFTSWETKVRPSGRRFMRMMCSVPGFLLPQRKQKVQEQQQIYVAQSNVVWLPPLVAPLPLVQGPTGARNPPLRCSSALPKVSCFQPEGTRAGSVLLIRIRFNNSPKFLKREDVILHAPASTLRIARVNFHTLWEQYCSTRPTVPMPTITAMLLSSTSTFPVTGHTGTGFQLTTPRKTSRGHWALAENGRGWKWMIFNVPSTLNHSRILW